MFERHKLEKEEGKSYNESNVRYMNCQLSQIHVNLYQQVSDQMKALNRKFGKLHGISSLFNLTAVIAASFHGLWIGNAGVKGY